MSPRPEPNTNQYLYCIIRNPKSWQFNSLGIGEQGAPIDVVSFMELAAVISASSMTEYDESRRNMMAHTLVLEEAMRHFTILPVRFGTVAPCLEAVVERVLKRRYGELLSLLEEMEGRIELGLKAFWYEEVIFHEIMEENPSIRNLRDNLLNRSPEETYYERIRLGEAIEQAMNLKRDKDAENILHRLRSLVYKTRANKVITDKMVLNAAFLLNKEHEPEFDQAVHSLDTVMGKRLMFKYVGPVPPYNFVNLVIHWNE